MRRTALLLTLPLAAVLLLAGGARPADDDEPRIGPYTASFLMGVLKTDKEVKRRRAALSGLEQIGLKSPKGVLTVIAALKEDADPELREAAAQALGRLAQQAEEVPKEPKDKRKEAAEMRDGCLTALRTALKEDRDPKDAKADAKRAKVREACAGALGRVGTDLLTRRKEEEREQSLILGFRAAVPILTEALRDPDSGVRAAAAESLGRLSDYAHDAVPALIEAFKDKTADRFVRGYAAFAIGRIGGDGARGAVPALAEALTDKNTPDDVRRSVATALGALKTDGAGGAEALGKALKDRNVEVRRAAAAALGQIGPEAHGALAALLEAAKDEDKFVRGQALHVLGTMPQDATAVLEVLTAAADDQVLEVRLSAVEALGNLGPAAKVDSVIKLLEAKSRDPRPAVRDAATEALRKIQQKS
jgi:HEAT repeat protein